MEELEILEMELISYLNEIIHHEDMLDQRRRNIKEARKMLYSTIDDLDLDLQYELNLIDEDIKNQILIEGKIALIKDLLDIEDKNVSLETLQTSFEHYCQNNPIEKEAISVKKVRKLGYMIADRDPMILKETKLINEVINLLPEEFKKLMDNYLNYLRTQEEKRNTKIYKAPKKEVVIKEEIKPIEFESEIVIKQYSPLSKGIAYSLSRLNNDESLAETTKSIILNLNNEVLDEIEELIMEEYDIMIGMIQDKLTTPKEVEEDLLRMEAQLTIISYEKIDSTKRKLHKD